MAHGIEMEKCRCLHRHRWFHRRFHPFNRCHHILQKGKEKKREKRKHSVKIEKAQFRWQNQFRGKIDALQSPA